MVYVSVTSHVKSPSVRLSDKSAELVKEARADQNALEARQKRLPPFVQRLLTGAYSDMYAFMNARFPNIGSATFAVPLYAVGVDGQRREVWPEVERKIDEARVRHETGLLKASEMLATGELAKMARAFVGDAFKPEILPQSEATLREWYSFEILVDVKPSPAFTEWLANIGQAERDRLEKDIEASRNTKANAEKAALREPLVAGIRDLLDTVIERADKDGVHWKRIADKVERLVTILPAFNVDNDDRINKLLADIADKFKVIKTEGEALKDKDNPKRKEIVAEAKRIAKVFDTF